MCVLEYMYLRNSNLKQVVLDELLAQHGDAQLNAQFHQTAGVSALQQVQQKKNTVIQYQLH